MQVILLLPNPSEKSYSNEQGFTELGSYLFWMQPFGVIEPVI